MRRALAATAAVVLLGSASACKSQVDRYCQAVRADQVAFGDMVGSGRADGLLTGLPLLRRLASQAPDDLTDEWQTFLNAVLGLEDAVHAAGLSHRAVRDGIPRSVTGQDRRDIAAAATRLASSDVVSAADGIETQARDVCKVNLGV